jgi:hypothetical protein
MPRTQIETRFLLQTGVEQAETSSCAPYRYRRQSDLHQNASQPVRRLYAMNDTLRQILFSPHCCLPACSGVLGSHFQRKIFQLSHIKLQAHHRRLPE